LWPEWLWLAMLGGMGFGGVRGAGIPGPRPRDASRIRDAAAGAGVGVAVGRFLLRYVEFQLKIAGTAVMFVAYPEEILSLEPADMPGAPPSRAHGDIRQI
jgi:hypothetical protein